MPTVTAVCKAGPAVGFAPTYSRTLAGSGAPVTGSGFAAAMRSPNASGLAATNLSTFTMMRSVFSSFERWNFVANPRTACSPSGLFGFVEVCEKRTVAGTGVVCRCSAVVNALASPFGVKVAS
jgi:hypothetical protein